MKQYVGIKMIEAKPINRGDYNKYRGIIDKSKSGFDYEVGWE